MNKTSHKKKKIGFVVTSLANGGAERSNAMISIMLKELGYEVFLLSIIDKVDFEYGGEFIPLGNQLTRNIFYKKWSKFLHLKEIFRHYQFDIVIDGRTRLTFFKEIIYKHFLYKNHRCYLLVHSSNLEMYLTSKKWVAKYLYASNNLISVSKKSNEKIKDTYGFNAVTTIYNTIDKKFVLKKAKEYPVECESSYILFYGRFDNESKNLLFLLETYSISELSRLNVKLMLVGKGPDEYILKEKVSELGLNKDVVFKAYTSNPLPYVDKALFTVMTSNFEGFPMTIIESLTTGTPVVSLDFVSGPSEVIETGKNGILVKEKTIEAFSIALNKMIIDKKFYQKCVEGTKESVKFFEKKYIKEKWDTLLNEL